MDLGDEDRRAQWREQLGAMFRGRKVITGMAPLAGLTRWVGLLQHAGAARPLVLALGRGAGPVPSDEQAQTLVLEPGSYASMTEELRDHDRVARNLPEPARAAVAAYDPTGEAVWLLGPFVSDEPLMGRPVYGGRPAAWLALEDKLLAEGLWRAVGAAHAPAAVVPVAADALDAASDRLDLGHGVVWAGDARDGFNGGGDFTRWVVTAADRADALRFFTPRCDRVRVMPFLEGVPCSIHGIVLPDGTAAFRPVELAIMRGVGRRFVYGGQGSTWDPPGVDRLAMRELARRTGEHLRERVGYRGGFGIDGVLTVDGFRPTELNTRASAGLSTLGQAADDEAFTLLDKACVVGRNPGVCVADLESWALPAMDGHRVARATTICRRRLTEDSVDLPVAWDGRALTRCPSAQARAAVSVGPTGAGTFARVVGDLLTPGDRLAPLNAALLAFLDAELGAGFGEVTAAPDVRRG